MPLAANGDDPDLVPVSMSVSVIAQGTARATCVVTNAGNGAANPNWYDRLYWSSNATYEAGDISLSSHYHYTGAVPGESDYTYTIDFSLRDEMLSDGYFILRTDTSDDILESDEANNELAVVENLPFPDLEPVSLQLLGPALPGKAVSAAYAITNSGEGVAFPWWYDAVYISDNAAWDASDTRLASWGRGQEMPAFARQTYTNTFTLPASASGRKYLIVKADAYGHVFESAESNNTVALALDLPQVAPTPIRTLSSGESSSLRVLDFSPNGDRLVGANWHRAFVWNAQGPQEGTNALLGTFTGHSSQIDSVDFSPAADQVLSGSRDGTCRIWDTATFAETRRFDTGYGANPACYSADGAQVLAAAGGDTPHLWDAVNTNLLQTFTGHVASVTAVALSPDGTLAIGGSSDRTAIIWDTATGGQVHSLTGHVGVINAVQFSPDGTRALTGSGDGDIRVWDTTTGAQVSQLRQGGAVLSAVYSADGQYIVSCDNARPGMAFLWDTASAEIVRTFSETEGNASTISAVSISPDRTLIATAHSDGQVRLWESGLSPVPVDTITPLSVGTELPITLQSHGLYYFAVEAEAGQSLLISIDPPAGGGSKSAKGLTTLAFGPLPLSSDARFANLGTTDEPAKSQGLMALAAEPFPPEFDITAIRMAATEGEIPSLYGSDHFAQAPISTLHAEMPIAVGPSNTYYVVVFAPYLSAGTIDAQIRAEYDDFHISSISHSEASTNGQITVEVRGTGFSPAMTAGLYFGGAHDPALVDIIRIVDPTRAYVVFRTERADVGTYDFVVEKPAVPPVTVPSAFTVTDGAGAVLEARLTAPSAIRPSRTYPATIHYANRGDVDMAAPLFVLSSTPQVEMALSPSGPFNADPVQIMGSSFSGPAGVVPPGASYSIPVYFRTPNTGDSIAFGLGVLVADNTPVDWDAIESAIQPPSLEAGLWSALFSNFKAYCGTTWASFLRAMNNQATLLEQSGNSTYDMDEVFGAAFAQASAAYLTRTLSRSVDADAPAPGVPLTFTRYSTDALAHRFTIGALGRTWSHTFEYTLVSSNDTSAAVHGPAGSVRSFTRSSASAAWQSAAGDYGVLHEVGAATNRLSEKDGSRWLFGPDGRLIGIDDPNGNRLTLSYNGAELTHITHSSGQQITLTYNANDRIHTLTDHAGQVTTYAYDASGEHLMSVTQPGSRTTAYTYVPETGTGGDHALASVEHPDGTHEYFAYDSRGRLSDTWRDGNAEHLSFTYDEIGNIYVENASNETTRIQIGDRGQPIAIQDPLGNQVLFQYDANYNLTRLIDPVGKMTTTSYDSSGNPTRVVNPLGQTIDLTHAALSRVASLRDARSRETAFSYDGSGNMTAITHPDASAEGFGYDSLGDVTTVTNRRGQTITFTRDAHGRITRKAWSSGRATDYVYDSRGNLTSATDSQTGAVTMQYDARSFLTRIDYPDSKWFTFDYNDAGRRTCRTGHDGYILNYSYDVAGRLESLRDGTNGLIVAYTYDGNGRLVREDKGNGTATTYTYDPAERILNMVNWSPGSTVQSTFAYAYDSRGNRTSMTTLDGVTEYDYDAIGQLTGVSYPDGRDVAYTYDAAGNRTRVVENGTQTVYTVNSLNQYDQVGSTTYTHDLDGNVTSKAEGGQTTTYEYDAENRLVRVVTPGDGTWEYTYDALGNRTAAIHDGVATLYVHDPIGLVDVAAEYDHAGGLVARYNHALGLVSRVGPAGNAGYYAFDALGNSREITGEAGAIQNRYDYDAFGEATATLATIGNPFLFVGRFGVQGSVSGQYHMRARQYCATLGRFTTPDPIRLAGGANLYSYCGNAPTTRIDPEGLWWVGKSKEGEVLHWHIFFGPPGEAHGDIGFGPISSGGWDSEGNWVPPDWRGVPYRGENPDKYDLWRNKQGDDDELMRRAVADTPMPDWWIPGAQDCGTWVSDVLERYYDLRDAAEAESGIVRPIDPNDKIAPEGVGTNHLIAAADELEYMIRFENYPTASAPVQELVVVDYLDPNLDWSTVRFGDISYGDRTTNIADGVLNFTGRDIPPTNSIGITGHTVSNMAVDMSASFNTQNGRLEWRLKAIDTAIEDYPYDALAGILPPNDTNHCGEGYVRFFVKPKPETPIGTRIENVASIVFDTNDPIDTPLVFNTIGHIAPNIGMQMAYLSGELALGNQFTYTVTLNNTGINVASNLVVTNTLPAGVTIVDATANVGTVSINGNEIVWTIESLPNGVDAQLNITVIPTEEGDFTHAINVGGDNGVTGTFSPVLTIGPPMLGVRTAGGSIEVHWPSVATAYSLERATTLLPPPSWSPVTNTPTVVGDESVVPWGTTNRVMFFRLTRP